MQRRMFGSDTWNNGRIAGIRGVDISAQVGTVPQLNLHNTRVPRNFERLPSSRGIGSAQSRRARVRILPIALPILH
jgi:hypothetical protein